MQTRIVVMRGKRSVRRRVGSGSGSGSGSISEIWKRRDSGGESTPIHTGVNRRNAIAHFNFMEIRKFEIIQLGKREGDVTARVIVKATLMFL